MVAVYPSTTVLNQVVSGDIGCLHLVMSGTKGAPTTYTNTVAGGQSPPRTPANSGSAGDFQRILSLFSYAQPCTSSPSCTCTSCEASHKVVEVHVAANSNLCPSLSSTHLQQSPRLHQAIPDVSGENAPERAISPEPPTSVPECLCPPDGCSSSDGEWVWMTTEDWRVLEEFTDAAQGASEMLKEQRGALESQAEKTSTNGSTGFSPFTGEEVLLKELQQMRLQLAASNDEQSRLEQHNAELLKNCHFLHSQNMELKQKKAGRPRLNFGSSVFPKRSSNLSTSNTTPAEAES